MKTTLIRPIAVVLISLGFASASSAQGNNGDVYWRLDPGVKSCSMVLDPSLTQNQWSTFVRQVAPIASFKSLASAEPLGALNFRIALDYGSTPVDQRNPAWINTFTHPDADCPLGDVVAYPALRASVGISDDMDIGAFWTTAPNANYGMVGGEFKYRFLQETESLPAAALRASATVLTGVADFDLSMYSVELIASKKVAMFTPYAGLRGILAIGTETTPKVSLDSERLVMAQGYVGVSYSLWILNLAAEYDVSYVNTFALAVGVNL